MRKIKNPWVSVEQYNCFGCNPDNPFGLHMEFYENGDEILCYWTPQDNFQGWIKTMHGGILSTLIDEAASWVVFRKFQTSGVTMKLEVKFKKPVPTTETQLTVRAHLVERMHQVAVIEVSIENSKGDICTTGTATYYVFNQEKAKEMGFSPCELEGEELLPL